MSTITDFDIHNLTFKDLNELLYLKGLKESDTIEFKRELSLDKSGRPDSKEFAKDVSAFVNSKGGTLFIGIDEKENEICGISTTIGNQKVEDWISNVLNDLIDKTVYYNLSRIEISEEEDLQVLILQLEEGKEKPYYIIADKKPLVFLRKGTSTFSAKPSDIKKMYETPTPVPTSTNNSIQQIAKGRNIQQIAHNSGKIINTQKFQNVTEVLYDPNEHITDQQAKEIKDKVNEIVEYKVLGGKVKKGHSKSSLYASTWNDLYKKYKITKYTLLPKELFEECMNWLQKEIAYKHVPPLRKHSNQAWKTKKYSGIYARAKSHWQLEKEELFKFAYEELKLKKPIDSLKDLSDTNLEKLYKILFSRK